jgi:hypothetical protein
MGHWWGTETQQFQNRATPKIFLSFIKQGTNPSLCGKLNTETGKI